MATKIQKHYRGFGSFSPVNTLSHSFYKNEILKNKARSVFPNNSNPSKHYRATYFCSSKNYKRRVNGRKRSSSKTSSSSSGSSSSSSPAPASVSPPPPSVAAASYITPPSSLPPSSPTSETTTGPKIDLPTCTLPKRRLSDIDEGEENPVTKKFKRALEEGSPSYPLIAIRSTNQPQSTRP
jgi:hypothetical protein